jgi:hypothetical protein
MLSFKDSIVQQTALVNHDPRLKLFQPELKMVTHKSTPYLHDQLQEDKKRGHLAHYLRHGGQPADSYHEPTIEELQRAESRLLRNLPPQAPGKSHKEFARLRQHSAAGKRPFRTVGLGVPNPSKAEVRARCQKQYHAKIMNE